MAILKSVKLNPIIQLWDDDKGTMTKQEEKFRVEEAWKQSGMGLIQQLYDAERESCS